MEVIVINEVHKYELIFQNLDSYTIEDDNNSFIIFMNMYQFY